VLHAWIVAAGVTVKECGTELAASISPTPVSPWAQCDAARSGASLGREQQTHHPKLQTDWTPDSLQHRVRGPIDRQRRARTVDRTKSRV
jgi:hypothetical protein